MPSNNTSKTESSRGVRYWVNVLIYSVMYRFLIVYGFSSKCQFSQFTDGQAEYTVLVSAKVMRWRNYKSNFYRVQFFADRTLIDLAKSEDRNRR